MEINLKSHYLVRACFLTVIISLWPHVRGVNGRVCVASFEKDQSYSLGLSPWPAGLPTAPLPHPILGVRISVHSFWGHKHSDHCTIYPDVQEEISASLPHHLPCSLLSLMCCISQFYHFWQKWLTKTTSGSGLFTYLIAVTKAPSGSWPWLTVQGSVYHSMHWLFNLLNMSLDKENLRFWCSSICLFNHLLFILLVS